MGAAVAGSAISVAGMIGASAAGASPTGGEPPPEEIVNDLQSALDDAGADLSALGATDASSLLQVAEATSTGSGLSSGGGSSLTGPCLGVAVSLDADGTPIDAAADFDPAGPPVDLMAAADGDPSKQAFTASNPYKIDFGGSVIYAGRYEGGAPLDHKWHVQVYGANMLSGGDDNPDGKATSAGTVHLGDDVPSVLQMDGLLKANGRFAPKGLEPCVGDGFLESTGGLPILDVVGLVLALGGGAGLAIGARPREI
jgi:hypothetical protein